ncbi:4-amino-4-deoxychorismate lyase [Desulfonispora thiosulfatigenes DSM 11270]|uniref:4-amino-4-deoxychorismate lyase n=1 Tax=Desulfonispora thiosulfatigenes DSM 11270 TaxID=656914 RepID=A0A1W1VSH8_DESTI|nr:aminotransferase class IV [Desulfonispora thiosulfatigenes]SMB96332.1 4-amino-4-deoxychorismate lyase [Desulfonispora thiosulfatigenes DSM 11270]
MIIINNEVKKTLELDSGFMTGKGVFETILVIKGKAVFLEDHLDRLKNGLLFLNIKKQITKEEVLKKIAYFYYELNKNKFVLKISVSELNIIYSTRDYGYTREDYLMASLDISLVRRGRSIIHQYKTSNYLENAIELVKGREKGNIDMLFLNLNEEILEGCISNIFFLVKGEIITPLLELGILGGITRKWVINNFPVTEKVVTREFLKEAEGVFITNSLIGIMPIYRIEDKIFDSFKYEEIKKIYQSYINVLKAYN